MKNLILFALVILLAGCSKSNNDDEISIIIANYEPETFSTHETTILITQNGETTDINQIQKFLKYQESFFGRDFNDVFPLDGKSRSIRLNINSINFHSQKHATINYAPGMVWKKADAAVSLKEGNEFVVEHTKTDTLMWGTEPVTNFQKYPIKISDNLISHVQGNLHAVNYSFPIRVADNKLYVPIFSYMLVKGSYSKTVLSGTMNFINPNLKKQLAAQDTVLAQVRMVRLVKK